MTDPLLRLAAALSDRYTIERELGAGGMATVYLAEDLKHKRKVALKVLKPELAAVLGAERFVQEITTTAALQHPHILPLFDSGTADGFLYYVMPFIDGETLRGKLDRETQLGIDEAVSLTSAVADALDYAHRHGVIHRDIKPENILLHDGRPMVADFGIALALSAAAGGRMTETGMSLGTPFYMSPEQATAEKEITARSDVYSLGSVLYEMLTGNPPHTGASAQQIIMKIVTEEAAPVTKLRKAVPPNVAAAVAKALEKLPADRFESAKAFAEALGNSGFAATRTSSGRAHAGPPSAPLAKALPWALLVLAGALAIWGWWRPTRTAGAGAVVVSTIALPDSAPLAFIGTAPYGIGRTALALSPDGATLAYAAQRGSSTQIYLRPMDHDTVYPLAGTEGACCPIFSPDGAWLAFLVRDQLSKIRIGFPGSPIPITTVNSFIGADWADDGTIVVSDLQSRRTVRVNAETGAREELPLSMGAPRVLPGGRGIISTDPWRNNSRSLFIPERQQQRTLLAAGTDLRYAPTGHITYAQQGALWAVPFDLSSLEVTGEPLAIMPHLRTETLMGNAQYSFASNGLLVYAPGGTSDLGRLVVRQRSGRVDTLPFEPALFGCLSLSPDGTRLAARVADPGTGLWDLWVYNLAGGVPLRLSTSGDANCPSWSPDGRVTYSTKSGEETTIYTQSPSGRERPVAVARLKVGVSSSAAGWSPDGKRLTLNVLSETSPSDVVVAELDSGAAIHPVAETPALEWGGIFSPDGRWIAYSSSESGADEIYVQPYPLTGQRWRISRNGGEEPLWTRGGQGLVYRIGQEWWTARVTTTPSFAVSEPELLAEGPYLNVGGVEYAVSSDGERLYLLAPAAGPATTTRLTVVTNWFTMLKDLSRRAKQ